MTADTTPNRKPDRASSAALSVALNYYEAWTSKNFELAMTYIADDIVCDAPAGRIEGASQYRDFMGPFVGILKRAELLAAFGDDTTAVVIYDTETIPVSSAPGAECLTVEGGKIRRSRFIFDRAPFDAARAAAK
ncbi:MAG: nuclear transport factor 2 family protein [Candidatus Dormibacteria bacterium]